MGLGLIHGAPALNLYNKVAGGSSPLLTGLVSYWKLDEASGTRNDSHGTNHLTDNNTVGQAAGKIGDAALFVPANLESLSIVDGANTVWGESGDGASVSLWVYPVGNPTAYGMMFGRDDATPNFAVYFDSGVITTAWVEVGAGGQVFSSFATGMLVNTWYHVVAWFDPADKKMRCSIDNSLKVTTAAAVSSSLDATADNVSIGKFTTSYINGRVDEVGIWNRVLTAAERTDLYNAGNGLAYPF